MADRPKAAPRTGERGWLPDHDAERREEYREDDTGRARRRGDRDQPYCYEDRRGRSASA